jgi:WNK lysine deficient protein kinase
LHKVRDPAVRRFVDKCLAPASRRPSAIELLNDPFLQTEDDGFSHGDYASMYNYLHQPACLDHHHAGGSSGDDEDEDDLRPPEEEDGDDDDSIRFQGIDLLFNEHEDGVDIAIKGKRMDDGSIFLRLRITDKNDPGN